MVPFEKRKIEWMMFGGSLLNGIGLLLPLESMSSTEYYYMKALNTFSELGWGLCFTSLGIAGLAGLIINGKSAFSPFLRFFASLLLGYLLVYYAYLFANPHILNTGTLVYGMWLGGIGGLMSMYASSRDVIREIQIWRYHRNGGC